MGLLNSWLYAGHKLLKQSSLYKKTFYQKISRFDFSLKDSFTLKLFEIQKSDHTFESYRFETDSGKLSQSLSKWISFYGDLDLEHWNKKSWDLDVMGYRLSNWALRGKQISASLSDAERSIFFKTFFEQFIYVHRHLKNPMPPLEQFRMLKGLLLASFVIVGKRSFYDRGVPLLERCLRELRGLPPETQFLMARDLIDIKKAMECMDFPVPFFLHQYLFKACNELSLYEDNNGSWVSLGKITDPLWCKDHCRYYDFFKSYQTEKETKNLSKGIIRHEIESSLALIQAKCSLSDIMSPFFTFFDSKGKKSSGSFIFQAKDGRSLDVNQHQLNLIEKSDTHYAGKIEFSFSSKEKLTLWLDFRFQRNQIFLTQKVQPTMDGLWSFVLKGDVPISIDYKGFSKFEKIDDLMMYQTPLHQGESKIISLLLSFDEVKQKLAES